MTAVTYDLHAMIEEAWHRARRRRRTYAAVLALLAGVGIWAGLTFTGGSEALPAPPVPPGYHAVRAQGSVQHALVTDPSLAEVNGVALGKVRLEFWFDRETGLMRERGRWANIRVPDTAARCPCASLPAALFERYWPVDTTKFVLRPGLGTDHGREVIWIGRRRVHTFAPGWGNGVWIALDPRTHEPVARRQFATTFFTTANKPKSPIANEIWLTRFPDIPSNRFWFVLKNPPVGAR